MLGSVHVVDAVVGTPAPVVVPEGPVLSSYLVRPGACPLSGVSGVAKSYRPFGGGWLAGWHGWARALSGQKRPPAAALTWVSCPIGKPGFRKGDRLRGWRVGGGTASRFDGSFSLTPGGGTTRCSD